MKRELRVAMFIQRYLPLIGGAETQLAALVPALRAEGVAVTVVTRRYPGLAAYEEIDGAPVYRLPVPGPKALRSLSYTMNGAALLARLKPDVLHAHELLSPTTTAVAVKALTGAPVVVTLHSSGPEGDVQGMQNRFLGPQRLRWFARQVDRFVTITREIDGELAAVGIGPEKRTAILNAVDTTRFYPLGPEERAAVRRRLGLPEQARLVIFVGRLAPEKCVDDLLRVWPALRAARPDSELLILGDGQEEGKLRAMAGDGVRFLGRIADVAPYLQTADVFALPSELESSSVALLEAMACRLAVLSTAVGGNPELITSGEHGLLVPWKDLPALQGSLAQMLDDPACRASLAEAGYRRVNEHYSLSGAAQDLRRLYDSLVTPGGTTV